VLNPSAETSLDNLGGANTYESVQDTSWSTSGDTSVHMVCTGTGLASFYPLGTGSSDEFTCNPGDVVYARVDIRGEAGTALGWQPAIRFYLDDFSEPETHGLLTVTAPGQQGTLQYTSAPAPAGCVGFSVRWLLTDNTGGTFGGDHGWMDAFLISVNTGPVGYFDGDTPDTSVATYAWTGTAHASTSTRTPV
jgi:hypothetical protein